MPKAKNKGGFQYVKLPDGSYGKFRADATDTDITTAISRDFPEAYAKAHTPKGVELPKVQSTKDEWKNYTMAAPNELTGVPETPSEAASDAGITSTALGMVTNPWATARGVLGGTGGALLGRKGVRAIGGGETAQDVGTALGGLAGGVIGVSGPDMARAVFHDPVTGELTVTPAAILRRMMRSPEEAEEALLSKKPPVQARAREEMYNDLGKRAMARERESVRIGSPEKEAGAQPPILKVPIRPTPDYPLTPESVPGPDTAGKGNLLTPIAKRGDPRAAQELLRRGRGVLYVPEEYPGPRESMRFEAPEQSTQPPKFRQGEGTSVAFMEQEKPRTNPYQEAHERAFENARLDRIAGPQPVPGQEGFFSTADQPPSGTPLASARMATPEEVAYAKRIQEEQ